VAVVVIEERSDVGRGELSASFSVGKEMLVDRCVQKERKRKETKGKKGEG